LAHDDRVMANRENGIPAGNGDTGGTQIF
jgi:hypothetical protein